VNKRIARTTTLPQLLETYAAAARTHGEATEKGDHRAANRAADALAVIYAEIRGRGPEARRELLRLVNHDDPGIRLWSASHTLDLAPATVEPVLEALIPVGRFLGLSAKVVLEDWRRSRRTQS
jgi:hypothetical protein